MCEKKIDTYCLGIWFFIKQCPLKFISGNKWRSTKVGAKLLSYLVLFSRLSSDISLDFHDSTRVVLVKYLTYFLSGVSTKQFWNISKENFFAPLRY